MLLTLCFVETVQINAFGKDFFPELKDTSARGLRTGSRKEGYVCFGGFELSWALCVLGTRSVHIRLASVLVIQGIFLVRGYDFSRKGYFYWFFLLLLFLLN